MSRKGFALPLLLWLIAGMSLLATAVIQFANDEIRLSEQRIDEARVNALARGLALLAEVDSRSALSQDATAFAQDNHLQTFAEGWWAEVSDNRIFSRRYEVGGYVSDVVLAPGNAYVSLNDASEAELEILLREVGMMTGESAKILAGNIVDYRSGQQTPANASSNRSLGFVYVEQLLSVTGMERPVYDRLKYLVHPHATGPLDIDIAPEPLRQAFLRETSSANRTHGRLVSSAISNELSLEAIYAAKARRAASAGARVATVEIYLPSQTKSFQRVTILGSPPRIARVEPPVFGAGATLALMGAPL
jgi:type II secretory pathway component PulK